MKPADFYPPLLINDSFQNRKAYNIPKAQLVIADIPYNVGTNAYGSNPSWYEGGDRRNGESDKAAKSFFYSDGYFNLAEMMHFVSRMLVREPKERGKAPAMIIFCSFQQQTPLIDLAQQHGFANYIPLVFIKKTSPQVLKANMRIVGATEYALLFYRDKLPKFRGGGHMVLNWQHWVTDSTPVVHPTQKPVPVLMRLIETLTDPGDVVIDPCAGSGTTLLAAARLRRRAFGFEINRDIYRAAVDSVLSEIQPSLDFAGLEAS